MGCAQVRPTCNEECVGELREMSSVCPGRSDYAATHLELCCNSPPIVLQLTSNCVVMLRSVTMAGDAELLPMLSQCQQIEEAAAGAGVNINGECDQGHIDAMHRACCPTGSLRATLAPAALGNKSDKQQHIQLGTRDFCRNGRPDLGSRLGAQVGPLRLTTAPARGRSVARGRQSASV